MHISNKIERVTSDLFKQICKQCGGKGFYEHINVNPDTNLIDKDEIVSCLNCERGFIYGAKEA